jgi:hypothetical protein
MYNASVPLVVRLRDIAIVFLDNGKYQRHDTTRHYTTRYDKETAYCKNRKCCEFVVTVYSWFHSGQFHLCFIQSGIPNSKGDTSSQSFKLVS